MSQRHLRNTNQESTNKDLENKVTRLAKVGQVATSVRQRMMQHVGPNYVCHSLIRSSLT